MFHRLVRGVIPLKWAADHLLPNPFIVNVVVVLFQVFAATPQIKTASIGDGEWCTLALMLLLMMNNKLHNILPPNQWATPWALNNNIIFVEIYSTIEWPNWHWTINTLLLRISSAEEKTLFFRCWTTPSDESDTFTLNPPIYCKYYLNLSNEFGFRIELSNEDLLLLLSLYNNNYYRFAWAENAADPANTLTLFYWATFRARNSLYTS